MFTILRGVKLHNKNKSKLAITCCLGSVFAFLIGFVCQDERYAELFVCFLLPVSLARSWVTFLFQFGVMIRDCAKKAPSDTQFDSKNGRNCKMYFFCKQFSFSCVLF